MPATLSQWHIPPLWNLLSRIDPAQRGFVAPRKPPAPLDWKKTKAFRIWIFFGLLTHAKLCIHDPNYNVGTNYCYLLTRRYVLKTTNDQHMIGDPCMLHEKQLGYLGYDENNSLIMLVPPPFILSSCMRIFFHKMGIFCPMMLSI